MAKRREGRAQYHSEQGRQPQLRIQIVFFNSEWEWMVVERSPEHGDTIFKKGKSKDWPGCVVEAQRCLKELGVQTREK